MSINPGIRGIDNSKKAAIQCVKLLGQKTPENVRDEGNGMYSHTNARSVKRMLIPCLTMNAYKKKQEQYPHAKLMKCIGYYVLYWTV